MQRRSEVLRAMYVLCNGLCVVRRVYCDRVVVVDGDDDVIVNVVSAGHHRRAFYPEADMPDANAEQDT